MSTAASEIYRRRSSLISNDADDRRHVEYRTINRVPGTPIRLLPDWPFADEERQQTAATGPECAADRRLGNLVLLVLLAIAISGGIWLANAMYN